MRILATGGTGVVGARTVTELLSRGHEVVLLSRHAEDDARQWSEGVTPWQGDVSDPVSIQGAADNCDAVLHMVAIVEESDGATFESVNIRGTENILNEAARAGVEKFIYVSSLGAPTGESGYHRSKARGEEITRTFPRSWTIVRPSNVYGPGDGQISLLLRLVRAPTPIVPRIGDGDQQFQPIWCDDCAKALANVVERDDLHTRELDIAGPDITSQNDLIQRFSVITGRAATGVSVPDFLATIGAKVVSLVGWDMSFGADQVTMLHEGNRIPPGGKNALTTVLGVEPTPLDAGLRKLADMQPEQLPDQGVGPLTNKRYWADIGRSSYDADELFALFRRSFNEVTPVFVDADAEPSAATEIAEGETLTLALPLRGNVQVRAVEVDARHVTLITLEGHPLAGAVRFSCEPRGELLRFQVEVFDRAANLIDLVAMRTLGDALQHQSWLQVVDNMIVKSEGYSPDGPQQQSTKVGESEAREIDAWLHDITLQHKREENEEEITAPSRQSRG